MTNRLEDEIQRILSPMNGEEEAQSSGEPEKTLHIHYFPDAIVITPDATLGYDDEHGTIVDASFTVIKTDTREIKAPRAAKANPAGLCHRLCSCRGIAPACAFLSLLPDVGNL